MKNEDGVWNCKNKKIRGLERYLMGAVGAQLILYFSINTRLEPISPTSGGERRSRKNFQLINKNNN